MTNGLHVNSKLMTSPRARKQPNACPRETVGIDAARQYLVRGETGLPLLTMHNLPRTSKCFLSKWKVDLALRCRDVP